MHARATARLGGALATLVLVLVLLAVVAGSAAAKTTTYARTIKDGRAAAQELLTQSGAASLSLALYAGDGVVWQEAFGYADVATKTAPQADTMYGIGSVSKMLGAAATMKLVDQGKLELDTPIAQYLSAFSMLSPAYRQITVRMLLDHSSGLPGATLGDLATASYFPGYVQEVLDTLARERLKTTPGYMSVYCNDGFTVAEALVLTVTGKTFAQYAAEELFSPLGMDHSAFPLAPFPAGSYAKAYAGDTALPQEYYNAFASGGAYSTPGDMARFGAMLMNGGTLGGSRVLSVASVAEMGTDQTLLSFNPAPNEGFRFGLGWDSVAEPGLGEAGVRCWMKGGDSSQYHASLMVAPEAKLTFVATGTLPLSSGALTALGQRVLLHALVDQKTLRRLPRQLPQTAPPQKRATSAQLAAMGGYWASFERLWRATGAADDPQALDLLLFTGADWQPTTAGLRLRTDGLFHADDSAAGFGSLSAGGRHYLTYDYVGGCGTYRDRAPVAQRLVPLGPLPAAWLGRVGGAWVAVNGQPDSFLYTMDGGTALAVGEIPGLPGYVTVTTAPYGLQVLEPVDAALATMFLQIPGISGRDLEDAAVESHGAEEWVRYGSTLYRPMASVPALGAGASTVSFGAEGYAEWRSLGAAAKLTLGAGGATSWALYGSDLAVLGDGATFPATVSAPAGSYLVLFGPAGSSITLTAAAD